MVKAIGGRSKQKVIISFDDNARKDYLSGFRKRKLERKERAQQDIVKRLKNQVKQERNKKRKAVQEKVDEILEGIILPNEIVKDDESMEKVDFGTHEVLVKTDIDFGDSGLFVATSRNDDVTNTESTPTTTKQEDIRSAKVSAKKKSKWSKLTQKKKKTKSNPHFVPRGEKKGGKPEKENGKKSKHGKKKR